MNSSTPTHGLSSGGGKPSRSRRLGRAFGRPLRKVDLVSEVVTRLRKMVLDGSYDSGGDLPAEGDLCEGFGVSRTVIREALRVLQAQGLIELSQGRRPRVRPIDPQVPTESLSIYLERMRAELADLVEVRRPIEGAIAAMAAERIEDSILDELEDSIEQLSSARKLDKRVDADLRFHELLAEATGNPIFMTLMQTIWGMLRQSRYFTIPRSGVEATATGHRKILNAVRRGEPEKARRAMCSHLDEAASVLKGQLECPISHES